MSPFLHARQLRVSFLASVLAFDTLATHFFSITRQCFLVSITSQQPVFSAFATALLLGLVIHLQILQMRARREQHRQHSLFSITGSSCFLPRGPELLSNLLTLFYWADPCYPNAYVSVKELICITHCMQDLEQRPSAFHLDLRVAKEGNAKKFLLSGIQ